jgi:hypothetical protein
MVEAGLQVYLDHCPDTGMGDALDREMIREIISAAIRGAGRRGKVHRRAA